MRLKKSIIAELKVNFDRSRMYLSYIQFLIILLMYFEPYRNTQFGIWFYGNGLLTIPLFFILFMAGSLFIGSLDRKFIRPAELEDISRTNPIHMKTLGLVEELHKKLVAK